MSTLKVAFAVSLTLLVAGCGYRPLKAPCAADEAPPLAYAAPPPATDAFTMLDRCGPMQPI